MAKNKGEIRVGDIEKVAACITSGLEPLRIEKTPPKDANPRGVRVVFVFSYKDYREIELKYLANNLKVDARHYADTIKDIRSIITNATKNLLNE